MSFPGNYNFNYYKGDTFEFRVYPKDSAGGTFPLSQFVSPSGITKFTMAPTRGSSEGSISGYAEISNDQTFILCAITPENGAQMTPGVPYVYDVEIARSDAEYDFVYTLLTGNITVTEQVTQPSELSLPDNPTGFTLLGLGSDFISVGWTAPVTGGAVGGYKIYVLPYTTDPATIIAALSGEPQLDVGSETTSQVISGLSPETGYLIGVRSYNEVGDAPAFSGTTPLILSNLLAGPITTLSEES